jgi:hypothetical protein
VCASPLTFFLSRCNIVMHAIPQLETSFYFGGRPILMTSTGSKGPLSCTMRPLHRKCVIFLMFALLVLLAPCSAVDCSSDTDCEAFIPTDVCGRGVCDGGTCIQAFSPTGEVCRASAGDCDIAESCTGSDAACPGDSFKESDFLCRASAGDCDVAEYCAGTHALCPSDAFAADDLVCRASVGACDIAET